MTKSSLDILDVVVVGGGGVFARTSFGFVALGCCERDERERERYAPPSLNFRLRLPPKPRDALPSLRLLDILKESRSDLEDDALGTLFECARVCLLDGEARGGDCALKLAMAGEGSPLVVNKFSARRTRRRL